MRAEKFEALVVAILEMQVWVNEVLFSKFRGGQNIETVCPITKAYAIATIYFPYLLTKINELNNVTLDHLTWIGEAALKKHRGVEGYADDLAQSYGPFIAKLNEMIELLNRSAREEFGRDITAIRPTAMAMPTLNAIERL